MPPAVRAAARKIQRRGSNSLHRLRIRRGAACSLYGACDLFVYPSFYEGFGLPILEAMACGRAVACSNTSAMPEVADSAALLFDPSSEDEIVLTHARSVAESGTSRSAWNAWAVQRAAMFSWEKQRRQDAGFVLCSGWRRRSGTRLAPIGNDLGSDADSSLKYSSRKIDRLAVLLRGAGDLRSAARSAVFENEQLRYNINWPSGLSLGEAQLRATIARNRHVPMRQAGCISNSTWTPRFPDFSVTDRYRSEASPEFCSGEFQRTTTHGPKKTDEKTTFDQQHGTATRETAGGGKIGAEGPPAARMRWHSCISCAMS